MDATDFRGWSDSTLIAEYVRVQGSARGEQILAELTRRGKLHVVDRVAVDRAMAKEERRRPLAGVIAGMVGCSLLALAFLVLPGCGCHCERKPDPPTSSCSDGKCKAPKPADVVPVE